MKRHTIIAGPERRKSLALFLALAGLLITAPTTAQSPEALADGQSLPDAVEAIQHARVTTRILYVVAHPDDEGGSIGLLAYLSRGLGADVALLSVTRGEGGQNALGPEIGPRLGVLRTEEFLAATRMYGTKLFFTRAPDFGYSKSSEETMRVWGDRALADMVEVIRTFRPHIIINNWGGVRGGHGHHVTAGLLTPQAFSAAADPQAFPQQAQEGLKPWRASYLMSVSRGGVAGGYQAPSDTVSPLWGKSYNEIGVEGFINHRTQGVVGFRRSRFFRGTRGLVAVEGANFSAGKLDETLVALTDRFPQFGDTLRPPLEKAETELAAAREAALQTAWNEATKHLAAAGREVADLQSALSADHKPDEVADVMWELARVQQRIDAALAAAAALRLDAHAERSELVAGEDFTVQAEAHCRQEVACELGEMRLGLPAGMKTTKSEGDPQGGLRFTVAVEPKAKVEAHPDDWMLPLPPPLVTARQSVTLNGYTFSVEVPVTAMRVTSTSAESVPLTLLPAVTLALEPKQFVLQSQRPPQQLELLARIHHYGTRDAEITAGVDVPSGWKAPAPQTLRFSGPADHLVKFTLAPPAQPAAGSFKLRAWARRASDGAEFRTSLAPLPTLPTYLWSEPATAAARVVDLEVPADLRVGYVAAGNDDVPEVLRQLCIHVELLDEAALAFGDLSRFDAIAVGSRAYELREDVIRSNQRLLDYAAAGGTLVVQYQRDSDWNRLKLAPYPATLGRTRVSVEDSPVRLLAPEHPVLNFPNKITLKDFDGWVQERGLYHWSDFDPHYEPQLGMHDPGEPENTGGLVYARVGKGAYIYTGLSFFRQLPDGVPGAFRLFINLLSQSRAHESQRARHSARP